MGQCGGPWELTGSIEPRAGVIMEIGLLVKLQPVVRVDVRPQPCVQRAACIAQRLGAWAHIKGAIPAPHSVSKLPRVI